MSITLTSVASVYARLINVSQQITLSIYYLIDQKLC
jgi:hypothetical protein